MGTLKLIWFASNPLESHAERDEERTNGQAPGSRKKLTVVTKDAGISRATTPG